LASGEIDTIFRGAGGVGVAVGVGVGVTVGESVGVGVAVGESVGVGVSAGESVAVTMGVGVEAAALETVNAGAATTNPAATIAMATMLTASSATLATIFFTGLPSVSDPGEGHVAATERPFARPWLALHSVVVGGLDENRRVSAYSSPARENQRSLPLSGNRPNDVREKVGRCQMSDVSLVGERHDPLDMREARRVAAAGMHDEDGRPVTLIDRAHPPAVASADTKDA
jgi:hypothetical protein